MATILHSESRRSYSWWWDSHISPKNSKWLQENLRDMDAKVKSMIKLIEEDADSFARRAEMYYKKRPELMKLVEDFYRAYRALAERYNHATGELRHAHRTIAKAFPDQVPFELVEDSPSKSLAQDSEPHTPEMKFPMRLLFDRDDSFDDAQRLSDSDRHAMNKSASYREDSEGGIRKRSLKFAEKEENENEVEGLKKALADMQAEKEDVLVRYQECLGKLANIEGELHNAQKDSMRLNEKMSRAEIEVLTLKEALSQLKAEKKAMLSEVQEDMKGLSTRTIEAENEAQSLKDEISRLELEKEVVLHQYKKCLEKLSVLENVIYVSENEARLLKEQAERAENEVVELKKSLADLNEEKEALVLQYKCCLEKISKLEKDISRAKEDVNRLNNDVLIGNLKLKNAEEKCTLLEMSNLSLRTEAENLTKKIAIKDRELSDKQEELENLQTCLQDEHLHHAQIEATLETLQNLHSQSQDDQRALAVELKNALQMLKDLEVSKHSLEEEIRQVRDENQSLSETNLSSAASIEIMQSEILSLREIKTRLENEVSRHIDLSDSLQQEILCLKEEIEGLNKSYEALVEQVEAAGLNPKCLGTSMKILQDENSKLRQMNERDINEKEILSKKLENMQELLLKKVVVESSLSDLNSELTSSRENLKALQESCQFLHGEKATLVAEKTSLISQLQATTENMHKLLEKNAVLENSLSTAKVELEGLREKSKGLEEICRLLKDERSYLLTERASLVSKLENVERKLESLEKRYIGLEEKYAGLQKEKEAVHCQVEELKVSLSLEKQERTSSKLESATRLSGLENQIHFLQEENRCKKKEYEEELDKSLKAQFEISILQKFIKDMEEKNFSLIIECQKHVEASKLAEKLISELESESLEQQVEAELLLDEIERLRLSLYQVFRALETAPDCAPQDKIENERTFVHHILGIIEDMKCSISKHEDDKQLLLVENSVLLTLIEQLESKEFKTMADQLAMAKNEKEELIELNRKLKSDVGESRERAGILKAELDNLCVRQVDLQESYNALEEAFLQLNQDNKNLVKKFLDLKEEKDKVDQHNDAALMESLATANQSTVFRSFGEEKLTELNLLLQDLNRQHEINGTLVREILGLKENLELQKAENLLLKEYNVQMKKDILSGKESLLQTEVKLEAAENLNSKLCETVDELKTEMQESLQIRGNLEKDMIQLSENNSTQKKEIESLHIVKTTLESEIGILREELEEKTIWEAEASGFYFDLQISSINEVLFKNKVQELTGVCRFLETENASKTSEIEQMKEKIGFMESEVSRLKSHLSAYAPLVAALRDDITFLEQNALLQTKLRASHNHEPEFLEVSADPRKSTSSEILPEDPSLVSLQSLQMRIKAVGKLMEEMNKPVVHRKSNSKSKQDEIEQQSKPRGCLFRDKHEHSKKKGYGNEINDTPKLQKIKTKASENRNGMLMKDIPLDQVCKRGSVRADDQMLELWETVEDSNRDLTIGESLRLSYKMSEKDIVYDQFDNIKRKSGPPSTDSDVEKELGVDKLEISPSPEANREVNARRILERLTSDAQKLENLQTTLENLRTKMETNKKSRKSKNVDFETVQEQLLEAEETVVHLMDLNERLMKNVSECHSPVGKASPKLKEAMRTRRRKIIEQARKGSERIGRLQLELQKIHYMLLKIEEERKNKGRTKIFKSRSVVLRDFINSGRKNSGGRRKKGPLCGCFRPSTSRPSTSRSGRS